MLLARPEPAILLTPAEIEQKMNEKILESEVRTYSRRATSTFAKAEGSLMFDLDGRRYLDFLAGCSALNYGHNDPDMARAVIDYVSQGQIMHGLDLKTQARQRFIESFHNIILRPRDMNYRIQFTGPTGTNAVEAALKLARKVTGRTNVIAFTNAFHGVTAGSLAVTGAQHHRVSPHQPLPGVTRVAFDGYFGPDIDTAAMFEKLLADPSSGVDAPAAVIFETVQAEGGLNAASYQWMKKITEIAHAHGAMVIIDDIQAGIGRAGSFFSFEPAGIRPDMITLSKSLSGFGLPLSVLLIDPEADIWAPGEHNGTFRGNNLAFVTATVALEKFWRSAEFEAGISQRSQTMHQTLVEIAAEHDEFVIKGRGMILGLETTKTEYASQVVKHCFDNGMILETAGPIDSVVKLLPALNIPTAQIDEGLDLLKQAFKSL